MINPESLTRHQFLDLTNKLWKLALVSSLAGCAGARIEVEGSEPGEVRSDIVDEPFAGMTHEEALVNDPELTGEQFDELRGAVKNIIQIDELVGLDVEIGEEGEVLGKVIDPYLVRAIEKVRGLDPDWVSRDEEREVRAMDNLMVYVKGGFGIKMESYLPGDLRVRSEFVALSVRKTKFNGTETGNGFLLLPVGMVRVRLDDRELISSPLGAAPGLERQDPDDPEMTLEKNRVLDCLSGRAHVAELKPEVVLEAMGIPFIVGLQGRTLGISTPDDLPQDAVVYSLTWEGTPNGERARENWEEADSEGLIREGEAGVRYQIQRMIDVFPKRFLTPDRGERVDIFAFGVVLDPGFITGLEFPEGKSEGD